MLRVGAKSPTSPKGITQQRDKCSGLISPPPNIPGLSAWQRTLRRVTEYDSLDAIAAGGGILQVDDEMRLRSGYRTGGNTTPDRSRTDASPRKKTKLSREAHSMPSIVTPSHPNSYAEEFPAMAEIFGEDFDPHDEDTRMKMHRLFSEFAKLESDGRAFVVRGRPGRETSWVNVPRNSSDQSFRKYAADWMEPILNLNAPKNDDSFDSARRMSEYLIRNYRSSFLAAAENDGTIPLCTPMTPTAYAAMVQRVGLNTSQEKVLAKHLRDHLGKAFLPTSAKVAMLSEGYTPIVTRTIEYKYPDQEKTEIIEFSEKDLVREMEAQLSRALQSKHVDPKEVKRVSNVSGGDKGGDAFQFGSRIKVEFHGSRKTMFVQISVAELICRQDTAELIERTILPNITKGLETIATSPLFVYLNADDEVKCVFGGCPGDIVPERVKRLERVRLFISGDLAFFSMALGRESMSGHWCFLCQLRRAQFSKGDERAAMWNMEELLRVAGEVNGGKAKLGVKKKPWWPFIPLHHYVIPLLHVLIGIGNDLLYAFMDWVNDEVESLDQQEVRTRRSVQSAEHKIIDAQAQRDDWDDTPDGRRLQSLKGMRRYRKNKLVEVGALVVAKKTVPETKGSPGDVAVEKLLSSFDDFVGSVAANNEEQAVDNEADNKDVQAEHFLASMAIADEDEGEDEVVAGFKIPHGASPTLESEINDVYQQYCEMGREEEPLAAQREVITSRLSNLKAYLSEMKKKLTSFRSVRKRASDSLESKLFAVLKKIRVELAAYHGGSLTGKDIKKVMDNSEYVFDSFKGILQEGKKASLPDDFNSTIESTCEKFKSTFLLWDGAFSYARKVNPTSKDREMFERFVRAAVTSHREVGCNITHKVHLMLHHVGWQMGEIEDGLGDYVEDWIEQAHQTGAKIRKRWRTTIDVAVRDVGRSRSEWRNSHPAVIAHGDAVHDRATRDLKAKNEPAALRRQEKREENRSKALAKHEALTNRAICQACPKNPNREMAVVPIHPSKLVNGKREREEDEAVVGEGCL